MNWKLQQKGCLDHRLETLNRNTCSLELIGQKTEQDYRNVRIGDPGFNSQAERMEHTASCCQRKTEIGNAKVPSKKTTWCSQWPSWRRQKWQVIVFLKENTLPPIGAMLFLALWSSSDSCAKSLPQRPPLWDGSHQKWLLHPPPPLHGHHLLLTFSPPSYEGGTSPVLWPRK